MPEPLDVNWGNATQSTNVITCPSCGTTITPSADLDIEDLDEGQESKLTCPHCQAPFLFCWEVAHRIYFSVHVPPAKPIPDMAEMVVFDNGDCGKCFGPVRNFACLKCGQEYCPNCSVEIKGEDCINCSRDGSPS